MGLGVVAAGCLTRLLEGRIEIETGLEAGAGEVSFVDLRELVEAVQERRGGSDSESAVAGPLHQQSRSICPEIPESGQACAGYAQAW